VPVRRIYALGPGGTFSERAAQRFGAHVARAGETEPAIVLTRTIAEALSRAVSDPESVAAVPIENTDSGTVLPTQDRLVREPLLIEWEIEVQVRFALIATGPLERVTALYVHPAAYAQCNLYLAERLPALNATFTQSNTDSGERLFLHQRGAHEGDAAAVVPVSYAEQHPELVVDSGIQNDKGNTTRFLIVRSRASARPLDFARPKTSLVIDPKVDRPGLLHDLLGVFRRHAINVCRIESRPARGRAWSYVFYLDITNNDDSAAALAELAEGDRIVNVLGTYGPLV
jgi:prephenate dehydratase